MKTMNTSIPLLFLLFPILVMAQTSIEGKWKTVDDHTGETTSVIEIYNRNGLIFGKIAKVFNAGDEGSICSSCTGKDKNRPLVGLNILRNFKPSEKVFKGGQIFDPSNGKEYRCKIWLDENDKDKMYVRGYLGIFYRTQNWYRI